MQLLKSQDISVKVVAGKMTPNFEVTFKGEETITTQEIGTFGMKNETDCESIC